MPALRYITLIAGVFFLLYLTTFAISFWAYPDTNERILDTKDARATIFGTPPRYVAYKAAAIASVPGSKYLIIGGSPALLGFRPHRLSSELGAPTHNLSLDSPDMSELALEIRLLCDSLPPERLKKTTLILGLDYLQFLDPHRRWTSGVSELENELGRFGLYSDIEARPHPRFGRPVHTALVMLLRPWMMIAAVYDHSILPILMSAKNMARFAIGDPVFSFSIYNSQTAAVLSDAEKKSSLTMWRNFMGDGVPLNPEQFAALADTVRYANLKGIRLAIVDLPIPAWHRDALPYNASYEKLKAGALTGTASMKNVIQIDLTSMDDEKNFFDSVHPTDMAAQDWERRVADKLLEFQGPEAE